MLTMLQSINLALSFLLELAMLAAYWGFQTGNTTTLKTMLGIGIPLLTAVIWGIFMAPSSSIRLQGPAYLALKLVLFGLAVMALIVTGNRVLDIVIALLLVINTILSYIWQQ